MELIEILVASVKLKASDVHLVVGGPPMLRVDDELQPIKDCPALTAQDVQRMIYGMLSDHQRARFEREWELDFSIAINGLSRFRANIFLDRKGIEAVLRLIAVTIPTAEQLQLPPQITDLAQLPRGLVLVTGPTGSGKSTTLACLINLINEQSRQHIITVEDPIEFIYENKNSVIRQRELGQQTQSYGAALKYALRQDPDVVLIGEMRDLETISAAMTVAETGHLVFSTLHTTDAAQTVDRIIDAYPAHQQQQIRTQLSGCLRAVIAQVLVPKLSGKGLVAAREIMLMNAAIGNMIREGKTHQIYGAIDTSAKTGMTSLDRALVDLVRKGLISPENAIAKANHPESLNQVRPSEYVPPNRTFDNY